MYCTEFKDIKWNGMVQNDPFKRPKSQVIFSVEGLHEVLPAGSTFDLNEVSKFYWLSAYKYATQCVSDG